MKVLHEWLQTYFDEPLPKPQELADTLTFGAFEIEEVDGDVIDVDVLPNRSSDCMCHRGIAREIGTLLDRELSNDPLDTDIPSFKSSKTLDVMVEDIKLCSRYAALVIENVKVSPSPDWLKDRLEALGQKSINNVVDATNYVMLSIGQPLHAFDLGKMSTDAQGHHNISVRNAKEGERITSLTGEEYELGPKNLLIVDGCSDTPIGIAGVKGGKAAEVDASTTRIAVESANFDYVSVRKTAQQLKLHTDASNRFQNEPCPKLVPYALRDVADLITELAGGEIEGTNEVSTHDPDKKQIMVTLTDVNKLLGTSITKDEAVDILRRLGFTFKEEGEVFVVTPTWMRSDIGIKEDIIEEIGRVYGYRKVEATPLPDSGNPPVHKEHYYIEKIRDTLFHEGFNEVYTYPLGPKGDVELENPLASDKRFLRSNLIDGVAESVALNEKNAPLLGLDRVKVFEIGTVYKKDAEYTALALGVSGKKADAVMSETYKTLEKVLGVDIHIENFEVNVSRLVEDLPEPSGYDSFEKNDGVQYRSYSAFPFVLRDVAVWVPEDVDAEKVSPIIQSEAGELLERIDLFDEFKKDGRISYAFHLVFQANDRTLSDDEVGKIMAQIEGKLGEQNEYEIR